MNCLRSVGKILPFCHRESLRTLRLKVWMIFFFFRLVKIDSIYSIWVSLFCQKCMRKEMCKAHPVFLNFLLITVQKKHKMLTSFFVYFFFFVQDRNNHCQDIINLILYIFKSLSVYSMDDHFMHGGHSGLSSYGGNTTSDSTEQSESLNMSIVQMWAKRPWATWTWWLHSKDEIASVKWKKRWKTMQRTNIWLVDLM